MTPAQNPGLPQSNILRFTLDGHAAPGHPLAGQVGASTGPLIGPHAETGATRSAPVVEQFK
jgi:hypothetical protein